MRWEALMSVALAKYLSNVYWLDQDQTGRHYYEDPVVYYGGLTEPRRDMMSDAIDAMNQDLAAGSVRIRLRTTTVLSEATLVVDDTNSGAYSDPTLDGAGRVLKDLINLPESWYGYDSTPIGYTWLTTFHEFGHALGLGHADNYNGGLPDGYTGIRWSGDEVPDWDDTVESYLATRNLDGSFRFALHYREADLSALRFLYNGEDIVVTVEAGYALAGQVADTFKYTVSNIGLTTSDPVTLALRLNGTDVDTMTVQGIEPGESGTYYFSHAVAQPGTYLYSVHTIDDPTNPGANGYFEFDRRTNDSATIAMQFEKNTLDPRGYDTGFDFNYYLEQNPDVAAAGIDPYQHFQIWGWHEGRNPNAEFDTSGYLIHNTDVAAAGMNPLDHYNIFGWHEGRDPSAHFDTSEYLRVETDVAAAGVIPLSHFLAFGWREGRSPHDDGWDW